MNLVMPLVFNTLIKGVTVLTEKTFKVNKTSQYFIRKLSKREVQFTPQTSIDGTLSIDKTSHSTDRQHVLP